MNGASIDIDRIVSEVLRRLTSQAASPAETVGRVSATVLPDRVVTLAAISGVVGEGGNLTLRRDAIVTPAAADELRRRGVAVGYATGEAETSRPKSRLYAVAAGRVSPALAGIVEALEPGAELVEAGSQEAALDGAEAAVRQGRRAVLWTDRPAEAVCRSNRKRDVWAVCGWDVPAIRDAARTVPVNLLIIDSRQGVFMQQSLLRVFLQCSQTDTQGASACVSPKS